MILWCDWDAEDNDGWHRGHMNDYEDHERRIEVAIAYVHDQKEKAEKKKTKETKTVRRELLL